MIGCRPLPVRRTQRGAALLLAMLIVTLVATLAGAMVWQQWRAIQVEAAERARTQSAWILVGALDWARLILREDKSTVDHLGEPWAVPLAEARLSSFLAADNSNADDGPEAFLSGTISDVQARYNLANLVSGGEVVPAELNSLQRLFENIGVASSAALTIAEGLRDAGPGMPNSAAAAAAAAAAMPASGASAPGPATPATGQVKQRTANPNPPLRPQSVEQLAWFGIDSDSLQRMAPYVALLPAATALNLNTASPEAMAAVIEALDPAGAQRLVRAREQNPFNNLADVTNVLGPAPQLDARRVGVTSSFFEVRGRLRLGNRMLEERSLVQRVQRQVTVLTRERINLQS
ncbi:MAG: type II secretion system minor pseudopilin GspK [Ideonella sp.]